MFVTVAEAVKAELDVLERRKPGLGTGALAASAMALAASVDRPDSTTSQAMCSKELRDTLAALYAMAPAEELRDDLDDLAMRRAARRATA